MNAALRMSYIDLQLITNIDIHNFIENSIRGGISMISTRHAQANNPSLPHTYDASPSQAVSHLFRFE